MRVCSVEGCGRKHKAKGYCQTHYDRWRSDIPLDLPLRPRASAVRIKAMKPLRQCASPVCDRAVRQQGGLCPGHYKRKCEGRPIDTPLRAWKGTQSARPVYPCIKCGLGASFDQDAVCWGCSQPTKPLPECGWCGKLFRIPGRHVFCSQACSRKANKRDYREQRRGTQRERLRVQCQRMERRGIPGQLTNEAWQEILEQYDYRCAYCGDAAEHIDHYVPIALGGTNDPSNIRPACAECNQSKGAQHPDDWFPRRLEQLARTAQRAAC